MAREQTGDEHHAALRDPASGFGRFPASAEAGGGARFGFNATDNLAFEVEGNFYPSRSFVINTATGGYPAQVQAGGAAGAGTVAAFGVEAA